MVPMYAAFFIVEKTPSPRALVASVRATATARATSATSATPARNVTVYKHVRWLKIRPNCKWYAALKAKIRPLTDVTYVT